MVLEQMKFTYMSDLHLEFASLELPEPTEPTSLILAGDIGMGKKSSTYTYFLADAVEKFDHVVYVPGNHEFYRGNFHFTWSNMKVKMADHLNDQGFDAYLHMLNREVVVLGDVAVICATMWTPLGDGNPYGKDATNARAHMNDYRLIRQGPNYSALTPRETIAEFYRASNWISEMVNKYKRDKTTVVVTHHAPSPDSIHPRFEGDFLNPAYAANLGTYLEEGHGPYVWVHGHMHNTVDKVIGKTHVLANPRGYAGAYTESRPENSEFDPSKSFTV
jgi:Icc-related predicted phosphoesterase